MRNIHDMALIIVHLVFEKAVTTGLSKHSIQAITCIIWLPNLTKLCKTKSLKLGTSVKKLAHTHTHTK